jgi:hypothetical protein
MFPQRVINSKTLDYDLAGNVTVQDGATLATYDDANKIATLTGGSVSYDTAGNLLSVAAAGLFGGSFTWDQKQAPKPDAGFCKRRL